MLQKIQTKLHYYFAWIAEHSQEKVRAETAKSLRDVPKSLHAHIGSVPDDDVVDDRDPKQFPRFYKAPRGIDVRGGRRRIPGRVVVHEGDGARAAP